MKTIGVSFLDEPVSVLGFGCASLGSRISAARGSKSLHLAHDLGVNWFDVAPSYGDGCAEEILGKFLKGRRYKVNICTKVGIPRPRIYYAKKIIRPIIRKMVAVLPSLRGAISKARGDG